MRGKCRFCKEEGHFACNCPNNNRNDWGEVSADGTAPANAEEGPPTPADSAPSSGAISDLRDNQLNDLTGSVAPGWAALSESLNNNATSIANSNINNESEIHSNDSSGNNENSESIMHSNDSSGNNGNSYSINVTLPDNNEMEVLDNSSYSDSDGSDDPEIRSDASIASLDVDVSSLDSVQSVDHEGFAVPLLKWAPRSSRKPVVVISPDRSRSVSPADGCRSRSSLSSGKHPLLPVVGSRPKSRKS